MTTATTVQLNSCTCADCGMVFGIDANFEHRRRADHKTFYCPNGHSNYYPGETDADRVKRLQAELEAKNRIIASTREQRDTAAASAKGYAGAAKRARNERDRIKARVQAGVCPCCNRTFQQLARHMAAKHPLHTPT